MRARRLNGKLRILHISDFHFKKGDEPKLRFLRQLHLEHVDMVFATGDMIDDDDGIAYCVEAMAGFKTRFGAFAVFGAHDHWDTHLLNVARDLSTGKYHRGKPNDFERLKHELTSAGIICLQNEARRIAMTPASTDELWVVGIDDMFAGLADIKTALHGVSPSAAKILLTHCVEDPAALAAHGFDAVFAGHSHGGQVRLPLIGAVITRSSLPRKHARGTFESKGTGFHINNGLGTGKWTGFRFLCPPEATYVTLQGAEGKHSALGKSGT
jgi:hypothetical protein